MPRLSSLDRSLTDRVVVVTGAASGMGRAIARCFADEGAWLAVVDRDGDGLDAVVAELTGAGTRAHGWTIDLTDPAAIAALPAEVRRRIGPVDVLVNNAGVAAGAPIDAGDAYDAAWAAAMGVNLEAPVALIRAFLEDLRRNGDGRIVNISSTEGVGGSAGLSPYAASKHGVIGITRSLAVELATAGVTVNAVCPGPINTGMTAVIPDEDKARWARRRVPMRRYGSPEEVAHAVVSLALPAMSFVTGSVLLVDGGMRAKNN